MDSMFLLPPFLKGDLRGILMTLAKNESSEVRSISGIIPRRCAPGIVRLTNFITPIVTFRLCASEIWDSLNLP